MENEDDIVSQLAEAYLRLSSAMGSLDQALGVMMDTYDQTLSIQDLIKAIKEHSLQPTIGPSRALWDCTTASIVKRIYNRNIPQDLSF